MIGVVLCGGSSTRMGSDKGLLREGNQTWSQRAAQKLAGLPLPVLLSINKAQFPAYSILFTEEQLVVDDDALTAKGPLLGLLSVHAKHPTNDLLVLACDMKDMTAPLLQNLLLESRKEAIHDVIVYTTAEQPEPLCGIYRAKGLQKVLDRLQAGEWKRFSMMYALENLHTKRCLISASDAPAFNNYNSPDGL